MKPLIFTRHAFKRLRQRANIEKYAEKIFRKSEHVYTEPKGVMHYKNGKFRFIVDEKPEQIDVITIIKE